MMNKKGQVAFLMLFLVAIILVVSTAFIFIGFSSDFNDLSLSNSKMLSNIEFGESYVISTAKLVAMESATSASSTSNLKAKFQELADKKDLQVYEAGNFFGKIRSGDFSFNKKDLPFISLYVLKIPEKAETQIDKKLFVQAEAGNNTMARYFDILCMIFDVKGVYLEREDNAEVYKVNCA